jgi:hypothetical protein
MATTSKKKLYLRAGCRIGKPPNDVRYSAAAIEIVIKHTNSHCAPVEMKDKPSGIE